MDIQLDNYRITSLKFEKSEKESKLSVGHGVAYQEEEAKSFVIYFEISLPVEDKLLYISYIATFTTSKEVDNEFKESHFPSVNAPAIAYPYLRAFVSQFLLLSGYEPQMLPTFNFVKMQEEKTKK